MGRKTKIDLSMLAERWPSAFVARDASREFTGNLISPKSLANLDSRGEGPEGAIRCGRKVMYPVASFIAWLEERSQLVRREKAPPRNIPLKNSLKRTPKGSEAGSGADSS